MKRTTFRIPIGDWSNDGHGKCNWYNASSSKSLEEVREAYFTAKKKLSKEICPENLCKDFENYPVAENIIAKIKQLGYDINANSFSSKEMADYVCWFINQGDPFCDVCLEHNDDMLAFYGFDSKNRHIGFIGYGFFE